MESAAPSAQDMTKIIPAGRNKICRFCNLEIQEDNYTNHFCQQKLNFQQNGSTTGNVD